MLKNNYKNRSIYPSLVFELVPARDDDIISDPLVPKPVGKGCQELEPLLALVLNDCLPYILVYGVPVISWRSGDWWRFVSEDPHVRDAFVLMLWFDRDTNTCQPGVVGTSSQRVYQFRHRIN